MLDYLFALYIQRSATLKDKGYPKNNKIIVIFFEFQ